MNVKEEPSEEGTKEITASISLLLYKKMQGGNAPVGQSMADSDALSLLPFHNPSAGTGYLLFSLKMSSKLPGCCP